MKQKTNLLYRTTPFAAVAACAFGTAAADQPQAASASARFQKPNWLTDLSAGVKEGYDDNVLAVFGLQMAKQGSAITTISPKVGFNFAPLIGDSKTLSTLSLVYSPDYVFYHNTPSESYDAHRIGNVIKGKSGEFSYSLQNDFLYNDGNDTAATYAASPTQTSDSSRSAYATAYARERRKQIQNRSTIVLQYDLDQFFVRPVASFLYYDFLTDLQNAKAPGPHAGYQNYADRYDVNGGLDAGYKVTKDLAFVVGYRYGHQYQDAYPYSVDNDTHQSSADYQRVLFGFEGKPLKWLRVKTAVGPEFRDYNHNAPVPRSHANNYYGEASLTATIDKTQSIAFTYKHWQWVSSTGKIPYADNTFALAYHINPTKELGFDLGVKYLFSDYNCGSQSLTKNSSLRNDAVYVVAAGVSYAINSHFSANLAYTYNMGRNQQDQSPTAPFNGSYREFDQQLVAAGLQYKF